MPRPFKNTIEKGKLKSELRRNYGAPVNETKKGTTIHEASTGYMKMLRRSGNILLKNHAHRWEREETIITSPLLKRITMIIIRKYPNVYGTFWPIQYQKYIQISSSPLTLLAYPSSSRTTSLRKSFSDDQNDHKMTPYHASISYRKYMRKIFRKYCVFADNTAVRSDMSAIYCQIAVNTEETEAVRTSDC
jgi:hypothetical protein